MMRLAFVLLGIAFVSLFFFPWPVAAALAVVIAPFFPVAPFALGVVADTLYLAPSASLYTLPVCTIAGTATGLIGLLLRRHLLARIIVS